MKSLGQVADLFFAATPPSSTPARCAACAGTCAPPFCLAVRRIHRYANPSHGESVFRYLLGRRWGAEDCPKMLILSLNPSTASAFEDDNTIRKDMALVARAGYGAFEKANLFAFRATDPADLVANGFSTGGSEADLILAKALDEAAEIVVAWGAPPSTGGKVTRAAIEARLAEVRRLIGSRSVRCFGTTKDGYPRHPLYLRNDTPLESYLWPSTSLLAREQG